MALPAFRDKKFLGNKYRIYDLDCEPLPESGDYFVLRLDDGGENRLHHVASLKAAAAYARAVKGTELAAVGTRLASIAKARSNRAKNLLDLESGQLSPPEHDEQPNVRTGIFLSDYLPVTHPEMPMLPSMIYSENHGPWCGVADDGNHYCRTVGQYIDLHPLRTLMVPAELALPGTRNGDVYVGRGFYPVTDYGHVIGSSIGVERRNRHSVLWLHIEGMRGYLVGDHITENQFRIRRDSPDAERFAFQSNTVADDNF